MTRHRKRRGRRREEPLGNGVTIGDVIDKALEIDSLSPDDFIREMFGQLYGILQILVDKVRTRPHALAPSAMLALRVSGSTFDAMHSLRDDDIGAAELALGMLQVLVKSDVLSSEVDDDGHDALWHLENYIKHLRKVQADNN